MISQIAKVDFKFMGIGFSPERIWMVAYSTENLVSTQWIFKAVFPKGLDVHVLASEKQISFAKY